MISEERISYRIDIKGLGDDAAKLISSKVEDLFPPKRPNDVPTITPFSGDTHNCIPIFEGQNFWSITRPNNINTPLYTYIYVDNNLELRAHDGDPSPWYFPNIFLLKSGKQPGHYIIYTCAIPWEGDKQNALAVECDFDDQWRPRFRPDSKEDCNEWCFICDSSKGVFALKWCGTPNKEDGSSLILHLDCHNNKLHLTSHLPDDPQLPYMPEHYMYIHNFFTLYNVLKIHIRS